MKRGIFGGSFDPPHKGHIKIALAAIKQFKLDKLIMVPTGIAPHKPHLSADVTDRVNMCRQLCDEFGFELSLYEAEKEGKCYTSDLLEHFNKIYPDDEFYLIVGGDSLDYMEKWHSPEKIFPLCKVVVAKRLGSPVNNADFLIDKFGAEIEFISCDYFDISSTDVRQTINRGGDVSSFLFPQTTEYIKKNNLYR